MIPILIAAHVVTTGLTVVLMGGLNAAVDVTWLTALALNAVQLLFEALAIGAGYYEIDNWKKRPGG